MTRWPAGLSADPSTRVRANSALPVAPPGSPARRLAARLLGGALGGILVGGDRLDRRRGAELAAQDARLARPRSGGRTGGRSQRYERDGEEDEQQASRHHAGF